MAHKTSWLVDKRILLVEYEGDVDKAEIKQLNEELEFYLAQGEKPVHLISDNRKMGHADLSLQLAREAFSAMKKEGWGWVLILGLGQLIRFFAEVFAAQFGLKVKSANNLEEAFRVIKNQDARFADIEFPEQ